MILDDNTDQSIAIGRTIYKDPQMNQKHTYIKILTIALVFVCLGAASAIAQSDVRMQISGHETYVGMPVTLYIQLENDTASEGPEFPSIDGLDIRSSGTPSQNSSVTIINGRRSESRSVTYSFQFTPRQSWRLPWRPTGIHRRIGNSYHAAYTPSSIGENNIMLRSTGI